MTVAKRQLRSYDDVIDAKNELNRVESEYLRERGWTTTSSTPGCYVLWTKTIAAGVLLVSKTSALSMQRCLDANEMAGREAP